MEQKYGKIPADHDLNSNIEIHKFGFSFWSRARNYI